MSFFETTAEDKGFDATAREKKKKHGQDTDSRPELKLKGANKSLAEQGANGKAAQEDEYEDDIPTGEWDFGKIRINDVGEG